MGLGAGASKVKIWLGAPPTEQQLAELGQIDVLMVPVDGMYTMSQEEMLEVIEQIRPALVLPMHYFGPSTLGRFLALAERVEPARLVRFLTDRASASDLAAIILALPFGTFLAQLPDRTATIERTWLGGRSGPRESAIRELVS